MADYEDLNYEEINIPEEEENKDNAAGTSGATK